MWYGKYQQWWWWQAWHGSGVVCGNVAEKISIYLFIKEGEKVTCECVCALETGYESEWIDTFRIQLSEKVDHFPLLNVE